MKTMRNKTSLYLNLIGSSLLVLGVVAALIALISIPLAIGHFKKSFWIKKIALTLLYVWMIIGIPISSIILLIISTEKEPSLFIVILTASIFIVFYSIIAPLCIKFYRSKNIESELNLKNYQSHFINNYPLTLMILILIYFFIIYAFHSLLFIRGIYPLFGIWLNGLDGILLISISISLFFAIIIGTLYKKLWAWWSALIYILLFLLSSIVTLTSTDYPALIASLHLPEFENNIIINWPISNNFLLVFSSIFFISILIAVFISRKYFRKL